MGTKLHVISSIKPKDAEVADNQDVSDEELIRAEDELREEARNLVHEIESKYWDLGRVLYDVYDGVPGGYRALMKGKGSATDRVELFRKWGYSGFGEYCEQEVGIRKRTAENLRFAYYWFAIQQGMPKEVIDELISVGRSKVYLLAGVADLSNITLWIDKAKNLTFEDLKKAISTAKAVAASKSKDSEEPDQGSNKASSKKEDKSKPLPKPEEMTTFQAGLFDSQKEVCDAAFERAQGLSRSEKKGHNMTLICQDFLANNDFDDPKKDIGKYLSKISRRLGLLIIAVDPETGKPVHNADLLWRLTEERQKADSEK